MTPAVRHRDFWLYVSGPRADDFERVFGTTVVAVLGPAPHLAELPGFDEPQLVYLIDLVWVSEQSRREHLVAHLAQRFGQDPAEVERDLDDVGMPILAAGTTLRIDNVQRWVG